jgi:hypothetical protein
LLAATTGFTPDTEWWRGIATAYSLRSAVIGSNCDARHAGNAEAIPDTTPSTTAPLNRMTGSGELPFAHCAR